MYTINRYICLSNQTAFTKRMKYIWTFSNNNTIYYIYKNKSNYYIDVSGYCCSYDPRLIVLRLMAYHIWCFFLLALTSLYIKQYGLQGSCSLFCRSKNKNSHPPNPFIYITSEKFIIHMFCYTQFMYNHILIYILFLGTGDE